MPLNVFEPRYLNMVDDAMAGSRFLGIIQPRGAGGGERPALEKTGCAGMIASHSETQDGRYLIVLQGVMRFDLAGELDEPSPYRIARPDYSAYGGDLTPEALAPGVERQDFLDLLKRFFAHTGLEADWDSLKEAPVAAIADKVAMVAPFDAPAKQALLEARDARERIDTLSAMMNLVLDDTPPGTARR